MNTPTITPIKLKEYNVKQSQYEVAPKLPMRAMLVGPSGSGKSVLLSNMILNIYKGCFSRIYIWSPSIDVDSTWKPVKEYIRDHIKPFDNEKVYFDSYEPEEMAQVIHTHQKVIQHQKDKNHKDLYQILIVIDDFANNPDFTRKSQLLHQLYIRGRHYMISTITSTQVYKQIPPIVRKNMTQLFIYRLRNYADLQAIIEELSAVYDSKTLHAMYTEAVDESYSFLYIDLMQKDKRKMFLQRFDKYLIPNE